MKNLLIGTILCFFPKSSIFISTSVRGYMRLDSMSLYCCHLRDTLGWKGFRPKMIGEDEKQYKFFWPGCKENTSGIVVFIVEKYL